MFNVGGGELLVILLVALIVLGPQRLPDAARQVGRVMGDIRRISSGFQQELKDALDAEPEAGTPGRTEPVPLAAAVAEADEATSPPAGRAAPALREVGGPGSTSGADGGSAGGTDDSAPDRADDPAADGGAGRVAAPVADALGEIVPPEPAPSDGDERAAS